MKDVFKNGVAQVVGPYNKHFLMNQARNFLIQKAGKWLLDNGLTIIRNELMVTLEIDTNNNHRQAINFLRWLKTNAIGNKCDFNGTAIEHGTYNLTSIPVFFRHKGHVFYTYKKSRKTESYSHGDTISINMVGRSSEIMQEFYEGFRQKQEEEIPTVDIYRSSYGGAWNHVCDVPARSFDSIILNEALKEGILTKILEWSRSEQFYKSRGIAYKLGLIFHGLPGTGKTSIVKAIASMLGYDLYLLDLKHVTDANIMDCLLNAGENSIIVIEEIDSCGATAARGGLGAALSAVANDGIEEEEMEAFETTDENTPQPGMAKAYSSGSGVGKLTLAGLLTSLDGLIPLNNRIIVMTTNDVSKLDAALLRKGRVDGIYEIPYLTQPEIEAYIRYMCPGHEIPEVSFKPIAGCDMHNHFLENKYDFDEFINSIPKY